MKYEEMIELAEDAGFTKAAVMDAKDLVFDASLRPYCEENICGNFTCNYSCPPDSGTPREMEERAKAYGKALVFQTVYEVQDMRDGDELKRLKKQHNLQSRELIGKLKGKGLKGLPMLAGPCDLCAPCLKQKGKPCAHPEEISSCLSAYCIQAAKMAESCDMVYWGNGRQVAYFSLYLFQET